MKNGSKYLAAAIAGIVGATLAGAPAYAKGKQPPAEKTQGTEVKDSHACKGHNECKGKGGCKTEKHTCKGQNECKGQGGCKS